MNTGMVCNIISLRTEKTEDVVVLIALCNLALVKDTEQALDDR